MRHEVREVPMPVPLATGTGAAIDIGDLSDVTVQVAGTFTGTVRFQGSMNGTDWQNLEPPMSTPAMAVIEENMRWIRVSLNYTSGAPKALCAGDNIRVDV